MSQQPQTNPATVEEQEIEIDLLDLFSFYLSKLPFLILALAVGVAIAVLFTKAVLPVKYTATSKMYMVSASSDSVVNLSDLNLGTSISQDYVVLMKSRPVIEDVIKKLELPYTYETLCKMINLSVINNTRIVTIAVTGRDPQEAMEIANQMARTSKLQLPKVMEAPTPSIAENAVLPTEKSSPSYRKNALIGGLIALLAVLVVLTIMYMMDDTLKSADDVEKMFGVMPLSVIPEGNIEGLSKVEDPKGSQSRRRQKKNSEKGKRA